MDLQETKRFPSNHVNVDVPFENLNLQAPFPGKGFMKYRKAQITLTSKKEEIVVKTVSDDAPVKLAKLQADEVRKLATLVSNVNIAQFLGRCNNVPNLLCYEFVNGTKLGEYLRENFQPSKIHQYDNTKQKRYHVPEKGSVETLPRVALQIARGMKYLTALKFLHPGLRSEKVIIDVSGQCKLYDFVSNDNAKDIMAILWDKSVPYQWMPPEYLFLEKLGPLVDVWSFGVLMWEIFSYGALPHEGKGRSDVEKELRGKENLPLPNNCPGAIWQITLNCWAQSPEKRPSFDHLSLQLSHMCNDNKEYDEIQSK
ncbi:Muscle, skeletal receptor tyrosine-protein kinase [Holothuria leucospilota]|uniref:Muscle, skeletal receptor tyrosine-protein kinase n=1 Tax=Holothuria leucospilota TaxID=206669 RepID=A0A9Q1BJB8_HOLLE|nr:Muscle, skeletal receptor tyrosine-protein kinase [Holothuria leucospilota]